MFGWNCSAWRELATSRACVAAMSMALRQSAPNGGPFDASAWPENECLVGYVTLDWASYVQPFQPFGITPWNPHTGLTFALVHCSGGCRCYLWHRASPTSSYAGSSRRCRGAHNVADGRLII